MEGQGSAGTCSLLARARVGLSPSDRTSPGHALPGGSHRHTDSPSSAWWGREGPARAAPSPLHARQGSRDAGEPARAWGTGRGSPRPHPSAEFSGNREGRVRGGRAPPAPPAGRARLSPRPALGGARLSPAARLGARLGSAAAAARGISPQLGSRPRPPGPRPCRPSSAWWSATGECAARRPLAGRGRPRGPGRGSAHGSGAGTGSGRAGRPSPTPSRRRPYRARPGSGPEREGAPGRGPGWPPGAGLHPRPT